MTDLVVVYSSSERGATGFGLPVGLNNWTAEDDFEELQDIGSDRCRGSEHHSDVSTESLPCFRKDHVVVELVRDGTVLEECHCLVLDSLVEHVLLEV